MRVRQLSHSLGVFYIAKKFGGGDRRGLKGRERGVGFLDRGKQAPPHQLGGLEERCKLSQQGPVRSPGRPSGFLHFIDARWLSWHHNSANTKCARIRLACFTLPKNLAVGTGEA